MSYFRSANFIRFLDFISKIIRLLGWYFLIKSDFWFKFDEIRSNLLDSIINLSTSTYLEKTEIVVYSIANLAMIWSRTQTPKFLRWRVYNDFFNKKKELSIKIVLFFIVENKFESKFIEKLISRELVSRVSQI